MADDPTEAGTPRTKGETRTYETDQVRVLWDATRCIHTAICLNRLPAVFDAKARPWIDLSGASAEEVTATIEACPTGALRYEPRGGTAAEAPDEPTTIEVRPNGPLYVRGRVRLQAPGGQDTTEEHRLALCRCGASENKPYCDNSHRLIGFRNERQAPGRPGS